MRKIVSMLFVLCLLFCVGSKSLALASSDNFGELNVKLDWEALSGLKKIQIEENVFKQQYRVIDTAIEVKPGIITTVEYLIPCEHFFTWADFLKIGLGASYMLAIGLETYPPAIGRSFPGNFSLLPVYFTIQANPFVRCSNKSLHGFFAKVDIGYDVYFGTQSDIDIEKGYVTSNSKWHDFGISNIMSGISGGYEFPFGLIIGASCTSCYFGNKFEIDGDGTPFKISKRFSLDIISLNIGYKFKI